MPCCIEKYRETEKPKPLDCLLEDGKSRPNDCFYAITGHLTEGKQFVYNDCKYWQDRWDKG